MQSSPPTNFSDYIKQAFKVSLSASKAYKITSLALFVLLFISSWLLMQTLIINNTEDIPMVMLRSFIDAVSFIFFCHFGIRPYLKLFFINRSFSLKKAMYYLGLLFIIALVSFSLSVAFTKLEYFDKLDITHIQFANEDSDFNVNTDKGFFYIVALFEKSFNFFIWGLFYQAWHMYQAKKQMKKQMQLAQIQQLTNQLSPHFLFNTFNSIRALIYEDQDKAADTLTQLSELFRTHLQAHLRAESSLLEEWQVSQRYISIEQTRLEERLTIYVEIDKSLYQQKLPTLTLLTLIENATKHGISPNIEPGFIKIIAAKKGEKCWQLSVINSVDANSDAASTKTGLKNIETRLALMFNDSASFTYQKSASQFSVSLVLPYVE
jgi:hypothetical protein